MSLEYRGRVRGSNPDTSWDAAAKQTTSKVERVQGAILDLLTRLGSQTHESLVEAYQGAAFLDDSIPDVTPQSIRTRARALATAGRIVDTGERRPTKAGATAAVWRVVVPSADREASA
jgi:hypothetical protein